MQTESLPVDLNDAEMAAVATELGELETELNAVKEAKKDAAKNFKSRIGEIQRQIDVKAVVATSGQEYRPVDCDWIADYAAGIKSLIRRDTGREVRNVHLTDDERQAGLFDEVIENSAESVDVEPEPESTEEGDSAAMPPEDEPSDNDAGFINDRNRTGRKRRRQVQVEA